MPTRMQQRRLCLFKDYRLCGRRPHCRPCGVSTGAALGFEKPPGLVDGPVQLQFQVQQIIRNTVGQVAILCMVPHMLHRIQIRGIRRQLFDPEPLVAEQRPGGLAIDRPPIYHHDQLLARRRSRGWCCPGLPPCMLLQKTKAPPESGIGTESRQKTEIVTPVDIEEGEGGKLGGTF